MAHNVCMAGDEGAVTRQLAGFGVTEREAEVLVAVSEGLRNREIAGRLYISVRTVESHVAALLRKLSVADRAELAGKGAELGRAACADTVLPSPLTSLVGREDDACQVTALLGAHRLVTLTGPAGVGKTRLALLVATAQAGLFPDGARLAELAPIGPGLVADTLARALGLIPRPGWSLPDILREVADGMRCLLVADNCEHVVGEAAEIVAGLLTTGGQLRVLATSREPLGVPGEVIYQVPPLPVPAARDSGRAATAGTYDAVRLFADRAAAASPGFTLTDSVAPAVAALCQRLDGLPLAIELAAARTRSFEPAELVRHLDQRFELLSAGPRTAAPRHRTLRGAIDWSYELLEEDERALFGRLGVFPADFDFEAVQSVCGPDDPGSRPVLMLLPALVDKSLVTATGRGTGRYRLLETIRAYAAGQLAGSATGTAIRREHAGHYLALAEQAARQLRTPDQRAWLGRLTTEQPNLRAALEHSITAGHIESAWRLISSLQRFWELTGQRHEAREWIQRTLAAGDPPASPAAAAGLAAASMILHPADTQAAFGLAQQAAQLADLLDDFTRAKAALAVGMSAVWVQPELVEPALRDALARFGADHPWERAVTLQCLANTSGGLAEALDWGREGVALFRRAGDHMYAANTLFIMAQRSMYASLCDDQVHELLAESQALAEAAGSEDDQTHATVGFGQLAWLRGDHDGAAQLMEECLPTLRRRGDQRCAGRALYMLGERAREQQQLARAEEMLRESVAAIAMAGQSIVLVSALESLAAVACAQDRPRHAALLLGTAHTARESASAHLPAQPPDGELRRSLAQILDTAAFDAAFSEGELMSPVQALQHASPARGEDSAPAV